MMLFTENKICTKGRQDRPLYAYNKLAPGTLCYFPDLNLGCDGYVTRHEFFAVNTGPVYVGIFREKPHDYHLWYDLIGNNSFDVTSTGLQVSLVSSVWC